MAIGVAVANAILLVTFAEQHRREESAESDKAAIEGAQGRLRPILMTSCAMIAGMIPMALGLGEGGEQSAPLGRAVIGGLFVATGATLLILPAVFTLVMGGIANDLKAVGSWRFLLGIGAGLAGYHKAYRAVVIIWALMPGKVFGFLGEAGTSSPSLDPGDPESRYYLPPEPVPSDVSE